MKKYKAYHTALKVCYALGVESVIPENIKKTIPRSTAHEWRNLNPKQYVGEEFAQKVSQNLDDTKVMLSNHVKFEKTIFIAYCRIKITLLNMIGSKQFGSLVKDNKTKIVQLFERIKEPIGGTGMLCKFFDVKPKTYSSWKVTSAFQCPASVLSICFKKVPGQITQSEVSELKNFMLSPRYVHYPIASVWALAVRRQKVFMSLSSWYRYCTLLSLTEKRKLRLFKKKYVPLRAEGVNQIWHADVSVFTTADQVKHYIYTVVDNFSRMILAWDITTKLSAKIRLQSIERAINEQFKVKLNQSVDLVVDGGSENNNQVIHEFIRNNQVNITKKIALKDIIQSNSLIESTFKIMKYKYFYTKQILANELIKEMEFFVQDYNCQRPHYSHGLYTPFEVHQGHVLHLSASIKQAIKDRVVSNRVASCPSLCH